MPDVHGVVKEPTLGMEVKIAVSNVTDLDLALKRRGIALEVVGLMSYEMHDLLRQGFVGALDADSLDARTRRSPVCCSFWIVPFFYFLSASKQAPSFYFFVFKFFGL